MQAIADGAAGAGHAVVAATGVRARIDRAPLLAIGAAALLGLVAGRGLLAITTRARRRTVQRPPRSSIAAALVLASLRLLGR